MISILLSWIVIGIYAYLYGRTYINLFYGKKEKALQTWDIYVICGIMMLTVYAQFFSLFHRVGVLAFVIINIGAVFCAIYLIYTNPKNDDVNGQMRKKFKLRGIILIAGVFATLLWTNIIPQHYDTCLYHAQAIRWIEEYGVVPGLGNLHFRLAYNSAFLSLQALFSFAWLSGKSLHTVNGFIAVCMLGYAITSFRKNGRRMLQVSDLLKLAMMAYFFYISMYISSPNTDIPALLLLFYICIKWSEFAERKIESVLPYSFLCLLCVYAITIKLSVAVFALLTIYPAVHLLQNKQWKQIRNHIIAGIVAAMPYLIRNVIISGYLIYPYPEIDLFNVDWKMSEQIALEDRREIVAWGRGNYDVMRYQDTISEWFPEWFRSIHVLWKVLFVIAVVSALILLFIVIYDIFQRKNGPESMLGIVSIAGMIFWLLSAPLPRYGIVYMVFLPCIVLGRVMQSNRVIKYFEMKAYSGLDKAIGVGMAGLVVLYGLFYFPYSYLVQCGSQTLLVQNDYENHDVIEEYIDGVKISRAAKGDQTGYSPFPSTPYLGTIESIELRGENLEQGFRLRALTE